MQGGDDELLRAFFVESGEILARLEGELAALGASPVDPEKINSVFRGLHTVKGNSSFLDLKGITRLAHGGETLLDKARKNETPVDASFLQAVSGVVAGLQAMVREQDPDLDVSAELAAVERLLGGVSGKESTGPAPVEEASAVAAPAPAGKKKVLTNDFIRIDEAKISKIISVASELELLRYGMEQLPQKLESLGPAGAELQFELDLQVSKLSRMVRSLSSVVFGVRLVPVNQVFLRFPRVVSDLARKLGKNVALEVRNGEAELDKSIVEAVADPMTHLIRNAMDHGLETEAERIAAGKNPQGKIQLHSYVSGNFVFIEITDDGRGIDPEKVVGKAVEKGIVTREKAAGLSENQKLALIFAPGFSTAETVTDISGRGVGMDVVKSNINRLRGIVILDSQVGRGTTVRLRFPLSMVVLFSLFVDVGGTPCALPMDQVEESLDFAPAELLGQAAAGAGGWKVYSLRRLLWGEQVAVAPRKKYHLLRIRGGDGMAFLVEDFLSLEEAIVQSVDSYIAALPGLQGASVRKDGSVALVLNGQNILELAKKSEPLAYARRRAAASPEEADAPLPKSA